MKVGSYYGDATRFLENSKSIMKPVLQGITLTYVLFNAPYGILVLKLFQMFDYLKLVNVELPSNAQAFLEWFEDNMFDLVPNFLDKSEPEEGCSVH